jgi:hypothetical protein
MLMQLIAGGLSALLSAAAPAVPNPDSPKLVAQIEAPKSDAAEPQLTPKEKMNKRFPQPVRVGFLIGLPVLDDDDNTLGRVQQVVRTPEGKISLIVSYGGWFGWGARPVAVPIEVVAILAKQIASLDMPPSEFATAPTWQGQGAKVLPDDESIQIALGRR